MWWCWFFWGVFAVTDTLPNGEPVLLPAPKHWLPRGCHPLGNSILIGAKLSVSGHEQHEKTCAACGAVRVTIIDSSGNHRRAWRIAGNAPQVETYQAPVCVPTPGAAG